MFRSIAAVILLAAAGTAHAVTFTSAGAPDPGAAPGQVVVFDFNAPTAALTGNFQLVTGSVSSQYAAPAGDATQYAVVPRAGQPNGIATLSLAGLGGAINSLSLYWGSIDTYNTLEFLNGANVVYSFNGGQLPPANGDQSAGATNRRVYFTFGTGETIDALRFVSNGVAFEFDDVAVGRNEVISQVPEPATWAMLVAGFGLVGFAARKRQRGLTVVAA